MEHTTPDPGDGVRARALVVDDHPLFARALELTLPAESRGRVAVVGCEADPRLAASRAKVLLPDLALVDLLMPEPGGLRVIAAVRRAVPRCVVVALSGTDDLDLAEAALETGAAAFLPKAAGSAQIATAVLAVLDGWAAVPPALLQRLTGARATHDAVRRVGGADRHLWRRLAEGRSTAQIAQELFVSERSVKRMTASLLRTLGVDTRMEAAALAGRAGLLDAGAGTGAPTTDGPDGPDGPDGHPDRDDDGGPP